MPATGSSDFESALIALGKLLGLLDSGTGIDFSWFGDPAAESLKAIPANRDQIGALFAALTGSGAPNGTFIPGSTWSPLKDGNIDAGFGWNSTGTPLRVGLGAQDGHASVLVRLFSEDAQSSAVSSELGKMLVNLPVPAFLSAASVEADVLTPSLTLNVADSRSPPNTRAFDLATTKSASWDAIRLALFILESWIHQSASGQSVSDIRSRLDRHLFALLGLPSAGNAIAPSALVPPALGGLPDFVAWSKSALTTAPASASTALEFLWHIRAFMTGEEDCSVLNGPNGAFYIQLVPAPAGETAGPPAATAARGTYPNGGSGAWIGIAPGASGSSNLVLSLQPGASGSPFELTLLNATASAVIIPAIPGTALPGLITCLNALKATPMKLGNNGTIAASLSGTQWSVTLLSQSIPAPAIPDTSAFTGAYSLALAIDQTTGVIGFAPVIPVFGALQFPPTVASMKTTFAAILTWLSKLPQVTATPFGPVAGDLAVLAGNALTGAKADPAPILINLTKAILPLPKNVSNPSVMFSTSSATVGGQSDTILTAKVTLGPIDAGSSSTLPVRIGTLGAQAGINLGSNVPNAAQPPARFYSFGFSFSDLRLGDQSGGGTGLIGSLLPDLNKISGFNLSVDWTAGKTIEISGGGTISIQKTLGPFDIGSVTVSVKNNTTIKIGIDLTFSLGPITISTHDLGFQVGLGKGPTLPPFLDGLGLSMDTSFITLSGFFGVSGSDYVGGASVSVADMFQLSAIGGYTKIDGSPSLFIFASLVAPLGGMPWMFITGVAGGFGLNRKLPPVMPIDQHPFLRVMSGDLKLTGEVAAQLQQLGKEFPAQKGEFWVAGGIQFISFGLIHGKVIVAVAFGHDFSLQLIGAASFGLSPVAYFEIDIAVTVDEEKFLLVASLSPNSYVIDPGLLSLRGDFALGVWHSGPHAGDFLLSIGGYHPYYTKPDYFPSLNRVGVKAQLDEGITIVITVEGFFALTSQAMMAGASASLSASIAGISAGLDVYVDVFIQWDPFFILADLGVTVWFVFFGRHEIAVDLSIHTPTFGGTATIHLFIISFSFDFGSPLSKPPGPSVTKFATKNLQVHAAEKSGSANITAFNTASAKGLFKLAVTEGRAAVPADTASTAQEGADPKAPILVNASLFVVAVTTLMPFEIADETETPGKLVLTGNNDLALCGKFTNYSTFTLTWSSTPSSVATPHVLSTKSPFPVAQFGPGFDPVQGDGARQNVAKQTAGDHTVPLTSLIGLEYFGGCSPATPPAYKEADTQESAGPEIFPLPLKAQKGRPIVLQPKPSGLKFSAIAPTVSLKPRKKAISASAAAELAKPVVVPLTVSTLTASWARPLTTVPKHTTAKVPAGATVIPAPSSPARRDELAAVSLRILPPKTTAPNAVPIRRPIFASVLNRQILAPRAVAVPNAPATAGHAITVPNGASVHTYMTGSLVTGGALTATGAQPLRLILLGHGEKLLSDASISIAPVALPRGLRSVFLIADEPAAPLAPLGAETHCVLLALGRRIFAGNGCVIDSSVPLPQTYHPLDSVPAADVLPYISNATVGFGTPAPAATLILTVRHQSASAGDASQNVRWRSLTANLGALTMITGAGIVAFVMPVTARARWNLELDLGAGWTLDGIVVTAQPSAAVIVFLQNSATWNLIDDRFQTNPAVGTNSVILEVKQ